MTAATSGPETPAQPCILVRFRGRFHEIPEGGQFPIGMCPFHPWAIALYVTADLRRAAGGLEDERPGWATTHLSDRTHPRWFEDDQFGPLVRVPSRAEAERFLLRGPEFNVCDHFTPRQLRSAADALASMRFVHPEGPCMRRGHADQHKAKDCPDNP